MILPSVRGTICPKDRWVLNTSLDSATVIQLRSAFMALMQTHTSTLCPHSNAPADGTTHTPQRQKGITQLRCRPGPKSCSQFDEVRVTKTCTDLVDLKPAGPQGPAPRAFPHCDFRGGVGTRAGEVGNSWMVIHLKLFMYFKQASTSVK